MKLDIKKTLISVATCEAVGLLGTPFTMSAIPTWYAGLNKPFFAPPNWIFGPVWTLLYLLMGVSFALIWTQGLNKKKQRTAATFFAAQLAANFLWTPLFFGLRSPELGMVMLAIMWVLIVLTIRSLYPLSRLAAYLLIPYLVWVTFAGALNGSILVLN